MKKIIYILLACLFFTQANAFEFNMQNYQEFDENAWLQLLSPLSIDTNWIEVNKISFYISNQDYFIFDSDLNSFDNIFSEKVLQNWNKKLTLTFEKSFSWKLDISWIKIRLYDNEINWAKIGLDYNNDEIIDIYTSNYINLEENDRYNDSMKTLPITNLETEIIWENSIKFKWIWSVDLDSIWTLIKIYRNNEYWPFTEKFIWKNESQEYILDNLDLINNYKIEFYSKDNYYLTDSFLSLNINELFINEENEENDICIQVISYAINPDNSNCETFNTPCDIPSNYEKVNICPVIIPQIEEIKKYEWNFSTKNKAILDKFTLVIDNFISKKIKKDITIEQKNQITEVRNKIIKQLEKYDSTKNKFEKKLVINDLVKLIIELKNILK